MLEITKNSTNQEIALAFEEQIKTGKLFSYSVSPIKTDKNDQKYVTVFVAQGGVTENDTQTYLTTGKKYRIVLKRNILGYVLVDGVVDLIKPLLEQGGVAQTNDVKIQEQLALKPFYDGQEPRKSKGGKVMQFNGENVYSNNTLVMSEADDTVFLNGIVQEELYLVDEMAFTGVGA